MPELPKEFRTDLVDVDGMWRYGVARHRNRWLPYGLVECVFEYVFMRLVAVLRVIPTTVREGVLFFFSINFWSKILSISNRFTHVQIFNHVARGFPPFFRHDSTEDNRVYRSGGTRHTILRDQARRLKRIWGVWRVSKTGLYMMEKWKLN